jgi:hypothetical protein
MELTLCKIELNDVEYKCENFLHIFKERDDKERQGDLHGGQKTESQLQNIALSFSKHK